MQAKELVESLRVRGFVEARRTSAGAVWLRRGSKELMIDTTEPIPADVAARLLREIDDDTE